MTCRDVLDLVEALADGSRPMDAEVRTHIESCPVCASALATAQRIEALLQVRPAPEAPARFAQTVQHRIRSDRWESEQRVDRIFNIAMGAAAILVVAAVVFLVNAGLVLETAALLAARVTSLGTAATQASGPSIGTYVAATGLLVSGLVMWWWAES